VTWAPATALQRIWKQKNSQKNTANFRLSSETNRSSKKSGAVQFHDGTPVAEVHCAREGIDERRKEVSGRESDESKRIEFADDEAETSGSGKKQHFSRENQSFHRFCRAKEEPTRVIQSGIERASKCSALTTGRHSWIQPASATLRSGFSARTSAGRRESTTLPS